MAKGRVASATQPFDIRSVQAAFLVSLVATLSGTSWHLMANTL